MAIDELKSSGMFSLIKNYSLNMALLLYYVLFESEFNQKYLKVLYKWRDEFTKQGIVFYNTEVLEEPLKLITNEPRFESSLKVVIYESIWIAHLIEKRLLLKDNYLIEEIEYEIKKLN
jgi:hypothetical protein